MCAVPSARFDTETHPGGRVWSTYPDRRYGQPTESGKDPTRSRQQAPVAGQCSRRQARSSQGRSRLGALAVAPRWQGRSEEHTSELQSLMRITYAVFCLKKKHHISSEKV